MGASNHTDETKDKIRAMWATGDSALTIGIALGMTRNAIIGLVNRMRNAEGELAIRRRAPNRPKGMSRTKARQRPTATKARTKPWTPQKPQPFPVTPPSPFAPALMPWEEWIDRQGISDRSLCGWADGDPADLASFKCCSGKVDYESVWCSYHKPIATYPERKRVHRRVHS